MAIRGTWGNRRENVLNGAIDKLDLRLPPGTKFSREATDQMRSQASPRSHTYLRRHYSYVVPLKNIGFLHLHNRQNGSHKLELVGVGEMGWRTIVLKVQQVCEIEADEIEIMRVDLAADVPDYPVEWFRQHARVKYKRATREFQADDGQVQSLYFGKRPNLIRIYDRVQKLRLDYRRLQRRARNQARASFEDTYAYPRIGFTLTRVERQFGGNWVSPEIRTLSNIRTNAEQLNPFDPLEFMPFTISEEAIADLRGDDFLKGHGILRLIETRGYHAARRVLDDKTCRNSTRLLKLFSQIADSSDKKPDLQTAYKRMLAAQFAA